MNSRWTQEQIFEDKCENKIFGVGYLFKKSKVKIKGRKSKSFAITFSFLLIALIFFIANLTNNIVLASTNSISPLEINAKKFYAISVSSFASRELANETAQEIKNLGGAGYLFFKDNKFYCLTSIYETESSANSVCNKLINMNYSPEIVEFDSKYVNYQPYFSKLNDEDKSNISNLLNIYDESFEKIENLSISYDQKQISSIECKKEILDLKNKYLSMHKTYLDCVENISKKEISALTQSLHLMFEKFDQFSEMQNEGTTISSFLKSLLINISIAKCELI